MYMGKDADGTKVYIRCSSSSSGKMMRRRRGWWLLDDEEGKEAGWESLIWGEEREKAGG